MNHAQCLFRLNQKIRSQLLVAPVGMIVVVHWDAVVCLV